MVWADSTWIPTREGWREARATEPGLLAGLPGVAEPPEDDPRREGAFNLVAGSTDGRVKKLPSLYVNNTQVYAARDVEVVRAKLGRAVDAFLGSGETPTYMLTACEIDGHRGLFGTDFFNRSLYRQKLRRLGMTFSDDLFAMMRPADGAFYAEDRDPFEPEFVTMPRRSGTAEKVFATTGAYLVYQLTYYRIADIGPEELSRLVALAGKVQAVGANEPSDLVAALTAGA